MVKRKWNNKKIDEVLQRLGETYELPPERSAALEARVRRDVIARFGSVVVPIRPVVHTPPVPARGMLIFRPAFVFAGVIAVVVGASVFRFQMMGDRTPARPPTVSTSAPVVRGVVADLTPGSGSAVSVFSVATVDGAMPAVAPARSVAPRTFRRSRPLTPAEGVFTTWGTSVFSDQEISRMRAQQMGVFGTRI